MIWIESLILLFFIGLVLRIKKTPNYSGVWVIEDFSFWYEIGIAILLIRISNLIYTVKDSIDKSKRVHFKLPNYSFNLPENEWLFILIDKIAIVAFVVGVIIIQNLILEDAKEGFKEKYQIAIAPRWVAISFCNAVSITLYFLLIVEIKI